MSLLYCAAVATLLHVAVHNISWATYGVIVELVHSLASPILGFPPIASKSNEHIPEGSLASIPFVIYTIVYIGAWMLFGVPLIAIVFRLRRVTNSITLPASRVRAMSLVICTALLVIAVMPVNALNWWYNYPSQVALYYLASGFFVWYVLRPLLREIAQRSHAPIGTTLVIVASAVSASAFYACAVSVIGREVAGASYTPVREFPAARAKTDGLYVVDFGDYRVYQRNVQAEWLAAEVRNQSAVVSWGNHMRNDPAVLVATAVKRTMVPIAEWCGYAVLLVCIWLTWRVWRIHKWIVDCASDRRS